MSTAFSYAQAARGQTSVQPPAAPQSVASQAASTTSSQSRDAATTSTTSASASAASAAPSTTSNDVDGNDITPKPSSQPESLSKGEAETDTHQSKEEEPSQKVPLSAAIAASPLPVQDAKKQNLDTPAQGTERRLKGPAPSTRASDVSDNKKSRKGKKTKGVEKDSEQDAAEKEKEVEAPKVQLSEAPIPAVNIWQLRAKEAQQKVTPSAALRPTANSSSNAAPTTSDPKAKPFSSGIENGTVQNRPTPNGLKNQKKGNEPARENNEHAPRRTATRGNRTGEKTEKVEKPVYESLPSVADVSSWPTPVTAATEVKAPEKAEKQEEKEEPKEEPKQDPSHKGKTNWVQLPYVPSPSFQTQFQTRSGRGGRAGGQRGGRENGTRGSHTGASNSVDKSQTATSTKASSGTQERASENTSGGKAASLPYASKRGSIDNSTSKDARKASAGTITEAVKPSAKSPTMNGTAESFKQNQGESGITASNPQQAASGPSTEKPAKSSSRGPDVPRDSTAQGGKEPNSHGGSRGEGNSRDRPRGGGQRGKGSFTSANGMPHYYANPNDQQPYPMQGNLPPRQNSYPLNMPQLPYGSPFPGPMPASGHRGSNSRNPSTAAPYYGRPSNGRNSRGPPLQTPPPNFGFEPSMHPASAFPGQAPYFPEQNMMALVTRQLEYYFSIENLLKDEWLRGHMDSQGFVLFDVIADFKRMKAMTQDKNLILAACEGSAEIELVVGNDDGRERIRRRHGWEKWVYPMGSRQAGANYDQGPNGYHVRNFYPYQPPMMPPYAMESPGVFSPTAFDGHFNPYMNVGMYGYGNGMSNGVNGHAATPRESQLSAAVPEFSPAAGPSGSDLERGSHVEGPKDAATSGEGQGKDAENATTLNGDAPTTNGTHEGSNGTEIAQPYTNGFGGSHEGEGH